jgi:hypothetical protein
MPTANRKQPPKRTKSFAPLWTKRRVKSEPWGGPFQTLDPRNMTQSQRRELREKNEFRRDLAEGNADIIWRPDRSLQQGVWHVPAYWLNDEAWILVNETWIRAPRGFRILGIEHLSKKAFATIFSYLPPLPEKAFRDHREASRPANNTPKPV